MIICDIKTGQFDTKPSRENKFDAVVGYNQFSSLVNIDDKIHLNFNKNHNINKISSPSVVYARSKTKIIYGWSTI